jgi:hypothetical protein
MAISKTRRRASKIPPSLIFQAIGPKRLAEFVSVRTPGKLVWFNFDLAPNVGLDVPSAKSIVPEFDNGIVEMLSLRALRAGEELGSREGVPLYADKYGGDDLGRCMGAGRAGFLPHGNFYLKGVGHTPLFRHDDPNDFDHSHGGVSMLEGMLEAVFGEVNANLFTKGSARILALIDQDDYTTYPDGHKEPRAIVVRAGSQLRPAHLFARGVKSGFSKLEVFTRITEQTGQLRTRKSRSRNSPLPDLRLTMLQIIDDHALTAAEQFRWRIMHGAVSMSNMEMSGAMLDAVTESAQPRTAPMRVLTEHPGANLVFGQEHLERAYHLGITYRSLVKSLSTRQRDLLNAGPINFTAEMTNSYDKHLQIQMLKAAGLKTSVARHIQSDRPDIARRFQHVLHAMALLRNRGSINSNNPPIKHISVLDIFHLLQEYPLVYFAPRRPEHERKILTLLKPAFRGNRFYQAKQETTVLILVREFANVYRELMTSCQQIAAEHYRRPGELRRSIIARAAYENRPMTSLYRGNLLKEFKRVIQRYKSTGDSKVISQTIGRIVSESHRNLDAAS